MSPEYDLGGISEPYLSYRYWHVATTLSGEVRAVDDNRLLVEVSGDDGKTFKELARHLDSSSQWQLSLVRLSDVFERMPKTVRLRISQFDDGEDDLVEAGIDDVRILEPVGDCAPGCGCRAGAKGSGAWPLGLFAVLALLVRRSKRF